MGINKPYAHAMHAHTYAKFDRRCMGIAMPAICLNNKNFQLSTSCTAYMHTVATKSKIKLAH